MLTGANRLDPLALAGLGRGWTAIDYGRGVYKPSLQNREGFFVLGCFPKDRETILQAQNRFTCSFERVNLFRQHTFRQRG
jgi:hypothetical protein